MNNVFNALVFKPGLPTGGSRGALQVQATGLEISVDQQSLRVPLQQLSCRQIGFGKPGIELSWQQDGETCAAHVLDAEQAAALVALPLMAGLPQVQALASGRRKVNAGRALGWSLMGLFVLLPLLLLLVFFWQADRIAGWVTDQIPVKQEIALGRQSFEQMKSQLKLLESGAAHDAVQQIGQRLTQGSRYSYEFHVVDDDTLNAFALPGGVVVVHDGLINATHRPEELAGVLAHEVQHVELRHSLKGLVKNAGLTVLWAWLTGDVGSTLAGQAARQLTSLKFSRDAETQADHHGFDTLVAKGIDPAGMPAFFKIMADKAADAPVAFMSTHPLSTEREAALAARMQEVQGRAFAPLPFSAWPPAPSP